MTAALEHGVDAAQGPDVQGLAGIAVRELRASPTETVDTSQLGGGGRSFPGACRSDIHSISRDGVRVPR
jgi:hypothetical protein